jgi:hypothetical protein
MTAQHAPAVFGPASFVLMNEMMRSFGTVVAVDRLKLAADVPVVVKELLAPSAADPRDSSIILAPLA